MGCGDYLKSLKETGVPKKPADDVPAVSEKPADPAPVDDDDDWDEDDDYDDDDDDDDAIYVSAAAPVELSAVARRKLDLTNRRIRVLVRDMRSNDEFPEFDDLLDAYEKDDVSAEYKDLLTEAAEKIAMRFISEQQGVCRSVMAEVGMDWSSFFEGVISFIEKFLPVLLQLLTIFGV